VGITKARGSGEGTYFDAYVMTDSTPVTSSVSHGPCPRSGCSGKGTDGADLRGARCTAGGDADRGTSMTSKTVAALLADLEVTRRIRGPGVQRQPVLESLVQT